MWIRVKGNIFIFNEEYYVQRIGMAMGTKLAPTYAQIFMGWLEKKFLEKKWQGKQPVFWKRYLDCGSLQKDKKFKRFIGKSQSLIQKKIK